jgi:uracil-DNA glycosylase
MNRGQPQLPGKLAEGLFGPTPWHERRRVPASGPPQARIALVGEAPGAEEEERGEPFIGASGQELRSMLTQVGIDPADCFFTNVFKIRPVKNQLDEFCVTKLEQIAAVPHDTPMAVELGLRSPMGNGKYLHPDLWTELAILATELRACAPTVVCALGNTALWATAHTHKIGAVRGTLLPGRGAAAGLKILPTFHPAALLRDWRLRPVVILDLFKLAREAGHPEIRRPPRTLYIVDTADELDRLVGAEPSFAVDVETHRGQITRISFAPEPTWSVIVAFCSDNGESYHTPQVEAQLWRVVSKLLVNLPYRERTVVFQNGAYDIQYLWKAHGIRVRARCEDTMIAHHALYPEFRKSLAFLGSIYTEEPAWKSLRLRAHSAADKGEDA